MATPVSADGEGAGEAMAPMWQLPRPHFKASGPDGAPPPGRIAPDTIPAAGPGGSMGNAGSVAHLIAAR